MNDTVRYLLQEVMGSGRTVTLDRVYTSVPLAEELAAERFTVVETLNKNMLYGTEQGSCYLLS